jgi:rubrerythrin
MAQAMRNAVETERAAERFYLELVKKADSQKTRAFFIEMSRHEQDHAKWLEKLGKKVSEDWPDFADSNVETVKTVPGWQAAERIGLLEALDLAISAEQSASLYYDAVADSLTGKGQRFFRNLAATELENADQLVAMRSRLVDNSR